MVSNSIIIKSPIIGIVSSIGFFIICSIFASSIFGFSDNIYLKVVLGFATFLVLLSLSGIFLILVREFTLELSMIPAIALGSILGLIALRKKAVETKPASENENDRKKEGRSYLFLVPLVLSLVVAFYALVSVRTGEGNISVWMSIPTYFLIAFFAASLSLMLVFFYSRGSPSFKLGMVSVFVFLSVSLFLLVWYPGRYGDPWAHLAEERFMASSGEIYAFDHLLATGLILKLSNTRHNMLLLYILDECFRWTFIGHRSSSSQFFGQSSCLPSHIRLRS